MHEYKLIVPLKSSLIGHHLNERRVCTARLALEKTYGDRSSPYKHLPSTIKVDPTQGAIVQRMLLCCSTCSRYLLGDGLYLPIVLLHVCTQH